MKTPPVIPHLRELELEHLKNVVEVEKIKTEFKKSL
jgi:hypothetical protein